MIPDLKLVPYSEIGQTEIMVIQRTKNQRWFDRGIQNGSRLSSVKLENFFEVDYGSITHGLDWKFKKKSNTRLHLHFFSERVVNWWNGLENSTVCAKSVNSFKSDSSKKNLCCTSDRLVMYCTKNGSRWVCGWTLSNKLQRPSGMVRPRLVSILVR